MFELQVRTAVLFAVPDIVLCMPKKRNKKARDVKALPLIDYLKLLPPPPKEHAHELNMEECVKQLLKAQEKNQ